jgi:hypothetical protein
MNGEPLPRRRAPLINEKVTAYHGTSNIKADSIVFRQEFEPSAHRYDWLGHGVYFWQGSVDHAIQWAIDHYQSEAAVVKGTITLGHCLDLLDTKFIPMLRAAKADLERECRGRRTPLPANQSGRHYLDCAVLERVCGQELRADTVRAAFLEGKELWEGSMFRDLTHIQIAVRDSTVIRGRIEKVYDNRKV